MKLEKIRDQLSSFGSIVEGWCTGTPVSELEKDIALEKLRHLYENVKALGIASEQTGCGMCEATDVELVKELNTDSVIAEINETVEVAEDIAADTSKNKINRKALLSLYDDCSPTGENESFTDYHDDRAGEIKPQPVPVRSIPKDTFVGECIDTRFVPQNEERTKTPAGDSLRATITFNDRFMMIRDMFGSDEQAFESAMDNFDSFENLDDAVVYMYENFSWNPNDESVKKLVDILTRKLA